ncbi:tetraacyldisaccharide 4'-kinase [Methylocystis sp. MJC1]|jgi:tetraacyldisaccharide 4'-kinase|uniref:tetraacyldisaccharide 4'-kinase n=1 Tax=Methylocystis sp. MJC1 TaxID=2654282 RepID=UPI0013EB92CE|nr:tetraacyldisaccharide 4'-kinase [Methylocystis sp. MJC1]KAF2989785.1 Tetraacyldisaccharide 4'-kinase [Methylocystis sp. MJC1]MBU6526327.1 tetraacyldisaccharide 4'-kinase [Methylocystis sp. MJC1]UZX12778.1 tetraacyldisaccharide 4'-kinase [Methylocystis sp. MJC1]
MRAPQFWRTEGVASRLLSPFGLVYGALTRVRLARKAPRASLPTIVVGGLTAGGDGKTPLVIALAKMLVTEGERPALLTRGYGKRSGRCEPFAVSADDDAATVGDEALLLSRHALAIVGSDRAASAALARELGATLLILDDGLQSRRLSPDLSLLVIDSDYGAGNGRCLPAGPLRAPLEAQIAAADALIVIGAGAAGRRLAASCAKPVFQAQIAPEPKAAKALTGKRVIGFAGIGRPEKFFRSLAETGAEVVAARSFPDHHRFDEFDLAELMALARRHDATLVTTEKDAVRLPPALDSETLPISLAFTEPGALKATLDAALSRARLSRVS